MNKSKRQLLIRKELIAEDKKTEEQTSNASLQNEHASNIIDEIDELLEEQMNAKDKHDHNPRSMR